MSNIKGLIEKKGKLLNDLDAMIAKARSEKRIFTANEKEKFNRMEGELNLVSSELKTGLEREQLDAAMSTPIDGKGAAPIESREWKDFVDYAKTGLVSSEMRANQFSTTDAKGGYTIPTVMAPAIVASQAAFGGLVSGDNVNLLKTEGGEDITIPVVDDTSVSGYLIAEAGNLETSATDMTLASKTLGAYKYTSGMVRISQELLQDSAFDFGGWMFEMLLVRLWRGLNAAFTTGDGSSKPTGVYAASIKGSDFGDRTLTRSAILDLIHSIDPAYRNNPKFALMMNDSTLLALKSLAIGSADASPLWQPSMIVGEPATIEGYKYFINQDMESLHPTYKPMVAGDFGNFIVRQAGSLRLVRLVERFADTDEVGFAVIGRFDSNKQTAAATYPLKFARCATT